MTRYEQMFAALREKNEGAFIPFVMLGDPNRRESEAILSALVEAGADALEVGIPFSDPVADGPTIQRAAMRALSSGVHTDDCMAIIRNLRAKYSDIPVGILTYANLVVYRGVEHFYGAAKDAGADSILIADVPTLEAAPFAEKARQSGIAPVMIAPPNASDAQLQRIAQLGEGYTYVVTRSGVTGADADIRFNAENVLAKLAAFGAPPAVFGFGISTPEHVRGALRCGAAGAISGSAIVSMIEQESNHSKRCKSLQEFVKSMKSATYKQLDST